MAPASRSMGAPISPVWAPVALGWQSCPPTPTRLPSKRRRHRLDMDEGGADQDVAGQARCRLTNCVGQARGSRASCRSSSSCRRSAAEFQASLTFPLARSCPGLLWLVWQAGAGAAIPASHAHLPSRPGGHLVRQGAFSPADRLLRCLGHRGHAAQFRPRDGGGPRRWPGRSSRRKRRKRCAANCSASTAPPKAASSPTQRIRMALAQQAVEALVTDRVLAREITRMGVVVPDDAARDYILRHPWLPGRRWPFLAARVRRLPAQQ